MSVNKRDLRSSKSTALSPSPSLLPSISAPVTFQSCTISMSTNDTIQILSPGSKLSGLSPAGLSLLRKKQLRLKSFTATTPLTALSSTLIFAQHEAGTAVCIHPAGWLLTCSHCIAEDRSEWAVLENRRKWLLYYTGVAVLAECRVWDPRRDLALLKVIAVEIPQPSTSISSSSRDLRPVFASLLLASEPPLIDEEIICIGQPGRDDLEAEGNRRTKYRLFEVSEGKFRGIVRGVDPQDNSEIGALKHDAWTYWGHSGAPLVSRERGTLVGLHSSWDEKTGMRHGIPWIAIRDFLRENIPSDTEENGAETGDFEFPREPKGATAGISREVHKDRRSLSATRPQVDVIDLTLPSPR